MYAGFLGVRHRDDDPNHLQPALRGRTPLEARLVAKLAELETPLRDFLASLPQDCDQRSKAEALTKLDELVMWSLRAIDK